MTNTNTTTTFSHGGHREGAGRKPTGRITRTVRLTPDQNDLFKALGASTFLQDVLDGVAAGTVAIPVDTTRFTEEEQDRFIDGWAEAGGPCDDGECSEPWCCPWYWKSLIVVHGTTPEQWGADFYRQCKPELDAILAEEEDEE